MSKAKNAESETPNTSGAGESNATEVSVATSPEVNAQSATAVAEEPKTPEEIRRDVQAEAKVKARKKAAAAPGKYRVTLGDKSGVYEARDPNEAWAMFCDAHKHWPSPKYSQRQIEKIA